MSPASPSATEPDAANVDPLSIKPFGFPDDDLGSVTINSRNLHS